MNFPIMITPLQFLFSHVRAFVATVSLGCSLAVPLSAEPVLRSGDLVAVCGDSITEQRLYSLYLQQYLLLCQPAENLMSMQFGWGGERAPGFVARVNNDVLSFNPTVATTCYGMNDGGYTATTPAIVETYRKSMTEAVRKLKAGNVRVVVVGSPGVVDPAGYKRPGADAATYNQALAALRDAAREVAVAEEVLFADVHSAMMDSMKAAKAARGEGYLIAPDGVHPTPNGQLAMAYAFLKAFGVNGDIGTLSVDFSRGTAEGSPGHRVIGYKQGVLEVESTRYPFCFSNKRGDTDTLAMSEYLPFNDELNRYRLVVKNAPANALVTWGSSSKTFTAQQLAGGINLAAEFPDNPFQGPSGRAMKAFADQQAFEVTGIKGMLTFLPRWRRDLPEGRAQYDELGKMIFAKSEAMRNASAAAVKPVAHQIQIAAAL